MTSLVQVCLALVFLAAKVSLAKKVDCLAQAFLVKVEYLVPACLAEEVQVEKKVEVPLMQEMNPVDLGSLAQAS